MFNIRHLLPIALCLVASCTIAFSQASNATFSIKTLSIGIPSFQIYPVDVDNNGLPGIVVVSGQPPARFRVYAPNAAGSLYKTYQYEFPSEYKDSIASNIAFGDFNGDGNVDVVVAIGNQLALFPGNGDGTFQPPQFVTYALPSGDFFEYLAAADFNGDGDLDLVTAEGQQSAGYPTSLYVILGDGRGNFGNPSLVYTSPAQQSIDQQIAVGNFNGDDKADIAFTSEDETSEYCSLGDCGDILNVLYNDGNLRFSDVVSSNSFPMGFDNFAVGDLNSDGQTDIFGTDVYNNQVDVLYAQPSSNFQTYAIGNSQDIGGPLAMADFNGDGRMDLVGMDRSTYQPVLFLANGSPGSFTRQDLSGYPTTTNHASWFPAVGTFNSDSQPDFLYGRWTYTTTGGNSYSIVESLNTTTNGNWGGCAYPEAGQGIDMCAPSSSAASPVTFNASANSYGSIRKMELWIDGKKAAEQYHTWGQLAWFNFSDVLASGVHRGVIFVADIDNRLQKTVFNFDVGGTCSPPASTGVNICMPAGSSTLGSPVQVEASSNVTGTIARMELWVDGTKVYTADTGILDTSIDLAAGIHRFAVLAVNTAGQVWENVAYATVNTPATTAMLTVSPTTINSGQTATLSWTTSNATSIAIDQGIGSVSASGTLTISPSSTTKYTLTATGPGGTASATTTLTVYTPGQPKSQITHVVIFMMQNHSFDNLFGMFPGVNGLTQAEALPSYHQADAKGNIISPTPVETLSTADLNHSRSTYLAAWDNGKMDQYALTNGDLSMGYYDSSLSGLASDGASYSIGTIWTYAEQYALADNFFASAMNNEPANGLYMIAATQDSDYTAGSLPYYDACSAVIIQRQGTGSIASPLEETNVGDQLTAKGVSWAWYQAGFDTEQDATCHDYVPQENVFQYFTSTQNSSHIQNYTMANFEALLGGGNLPSVVWIQPDGLHDMHPGAGNILDAVEWMDQTIKEIQNSSAWPHTAIFVLWDESGGWYDHVSPPQLPNTGGLGARVPFMLISPFAKTGYISDQQMDFVSILRFIQWNWDLGQLPGAAQQAREAQTGNLCDMLTSACGSPVAP